MNQNGKLVYLSYTTELNICIAPVLYFSVIFFLCNFHNHTQDITRKGYEEVLSQNIMEKKLTKVNVAQIMFTLMILSRKKM